MFIGCSSLETVPELPATVLATGCYYAMFAYCTSLEVPPKLPATTLASRLLCINVLWCIKFSNCA